MALSRARASSKATLCTHIDISLLNMHDLLFYQDPCIVPWKINENLEKYPISQC